MTSAVYATDILFEDSVRLPAERMTRSAVHVTLIAACMTSPVHRVTLSASSQALNTDNVTLSGSGATWPHPAWRRPHRAPCQSRALPPAMRTASRYPRSASRCRCATRLCLRISRAMYGE